MSYQLKLWDSKRERKLTGPNTLPAVCRTKGPDQVQGRAHRLRTGPALPEAGGRREGKGAGSALRTAAPTALQTGLQFLTTDLLRFWMVDIHREGRSETQGAGTGPARAGTGAGAAEGRRRVHPGRVRPSSSWLDFFSFFSFIFF